MPLQVAATRVDITPQLWLPPTGFSLVGGGSCWEVWHHLFATIILVDDGVGGRVLLIGADLHVGSRLVLERIAALLPKSLGIDVTQIFFSGSHTHFAPGNFYGHSYFDILAGRGMGRNTPWVEWLATRIATAVQQLPVLQPAKVGYAKAAVAGLVENRSIVSFRRNHDAPGSPVSISAFAATVGYPGSTGGVSDEDLAVDPNVHMLWFEGTNNQPIAGFASFGAHSTVSGPAHRVMTSDAFGIAVRQARDQMWSNWGTRVPVALVSGSTGDALFKHAHASGEAAWKECCRVGTALGDLLWQAAQAARANAKPGSAKVVANYREQDASTGVVTGSGPRGDGPPRTLSPAWWVGKGVARGGTYIPLWTDTPPNVVVPATHPQWPKRQQTLQAAAGGAFDVPNQVPVRVFRIGDVELVGVPGEPTTMLAHRIRSAVGAGRDGVLVCGYTGEYIGYLPTPEEYEHQDYEGASTLWGRWTGDWIVEQVALCHSGNVTGVTSAGFTAKPAALAVTSSMKLAKPATSTKLLANRVGKAGWKLTGSWCPTNAELPPLAGPGDQVNFPAALIFYEEHQAGKWRLLDLLGEHVTNQTRDVRLWLDLSQGRYSFEYLLPFEAARAGRNVRFEVGHTGLLPASPRSNAAKLT